MSEMFDEENVITLTDEDGVEHEFNVVCLIPYEGSDYVALIPVMENEDDYDGELVILEILPSEEEGTEVFEAVEDEAVLEAVFDIFQEMMNTEE